jgi:hypothetical protein
VAAVATKKSERAEFQRVEIQHLPDERCRVRVTLGRQLGPNLYQTYVGKAESTWSPVGELRCAADAALKALEHSFGVSEGTFTTLDIKTVESFDRPAVIVAISAVHGNVNQRLVGFCEVQEDPKLAAAKAALNGTNRFVAFRLAN